jgi:type I restriction enzyme S subunit
VTWQRTRLKYLVALPIQNGLGEAAVCDDPSWPRYIRTTDIAGPRTLHNDTFASLPPDVASHAMLEPGDIVLTAAGSVGKSFLYDSTEPACYAGYLVRLRLRRTVDPRFVAYWTESAPFWDQIHVGTVTSTIDNFSASKYGNMSISIPDESTQRAIADYLDRETARIDALIEKKHRMKELLQERRQTLITEAISRSHDPGATARGDRVMERPTVPIRRVAQGGGLFTDGDWIESPFITDEGIRLIQTGNVGVGLYREQGFRFISEETFHVLNCTEVLPGDLLICRLAEPVGRSCIAPNLGTRMITSVDVAILRPRPGSAEVRYLNYYFSSSSHLEFIDSIARGGTRQRISRDQLGFAPVPLPPIATQRAIADYLDRETARIDALVERIDRQVAFLQERRQALITAAVTGELEIPGVAA